MRVEVWIRTGFVLEIVDMVSGEMVSMLMAVVIGVVGKLVVVRR